MINIMTEQIVTMVQAARLKPAIRQGRPTNISTLYRWASRGLRGVRLEVVRLGGATYTTVEALQRFADRLTRASSPAGRRVPARDPPAARDTDAEFDQLGF